MTKLTPSLVARTYAGQAWPYVQSQKKIAKGIFGFSCAGHGGLVAVVGEADLNPRAVDIAREQGKTGYVLFEGGKVYTSERYQIGPDTPGAVEVLVGEEDCDWAVVIMSALDPQAVIEGARNRYLAEHVDYADVESTVMSWNPDFFEALFNVTVPTESSYIKKQRKFAADNADNFVVTAAWGSWHEKVPTGFVGVVAALGGSRQADRDERYFLVLEEDYDARNGSYVITSEQEWVDHA